MEQLIRCNSEADGIVRMQEDTIVQRYRYSALEFFKGSFLFWR